MTKNRGSSPPIFDKSTLSSGLNSCDTKGEDTPKKGGRPVGHPLKHRYGNGGFHRSSSDYISSHTL